MESAFYHWLDSSGFTPLNTVLLVLVALLARQRIQGLIENLDFAHRKVERLEKACIKAGIELGELEE